MSKFDEGLRKSLQSKMMRPSILASEHYEMGLKHPFRILLVEDDQVNRRDAIRKLGYLSYTCDVAEDGARAVEMISANAPYDIVFMDLHMPRMNGLQASKQIIQMLQSSRPYIIVLTSSTSHDETMDCLKLGIGESHADFVGTFDRSINSRFASLDYYFTKPLDSNELTKLMSAIIESKKAESKP